MVKQQQIKKSDALQEIAARKIEISNGVAEKSKLLALVNDKLEEAKKLTIVSGDNSSMATEASQEAALALYKLEIAGHIQPNEVTAILGDKFGFKAKMDGTPSKTPMPAGEAIRKRVVRAVTSHEYAYGTLKTKVPPYLTEANPDEVKAILAAVEEGDVTIWTAYDKLGDLKPDRETIPAAFNPAAVFKMIGQLAERPERRPDGSIIIGSNQPYAGAAQVFHASPELTKNWKELLAVVATILDTPVSAMDEAHEEQIRQDMERAAG